MVILKQCPLCEKKLDSYLEFNKRPNALCPNCASLERHRSVWLFLNDELERKTSKPMHILHFSPEDSISSAVSKIKNIDYYPVDLDPEHKGIRHVADITRLPYDNEKFDIIICNHVLQETNDDNKALSEIARVLKSDGLAYITIPVDINRKTTAENVKHDTQELRKRNYGSEKNYRIYGLDCIKRMNASGLNVHMKNIKSSFPKSAIEKYGLYSEETVYICER